LSFTTALAFSLLSLPSECVFLIPTRSHCDSFYIFTHGSSKTGVGLQFSTVLQSEPRLPSKVVSSLELLCISGHPLRYALPQTSRYVMLSVSLLVISAPFKDCPKHFDLRNSTFVISKYSYLNLPTLKRY
jgi:hypothetical protein